MSQSFSYETYRLTGNTSSAYFPTENIINNNVRYYTFTDVSNSYKITFSKSVVVQGVIVGGGGGGGCSPNIYEGAGGGGGGQVAVLNNVVFTGGQTYTITIGNGGAGGTFSTIPINGYATTISGDFLITASGGGYGGYVLPGNTSVYNQTGGTGGSGGGGCNYGSNATTGNSSINTPTSVANVGTVVYYGNKGGTGVQSAAGGGGGGAYELGASSSFTGGGYGGRAYQFIINEYWIGNYGGGGGGGGGGSAYPSYTRGGGGGGTRSGGNGACKDRNAQNGYPNTGGGGGGAGGGGYTNTNPTTGGNGGSGIVVLAVMRFYYTGIPRTISTSNWVSGFGGSSWPVGLTTDGTNLYVANGQGSGNISQINLTTGASNHNYISTGGPRYAVCADNTYIYSIPTQGTVVTRYSINNPASSSSWATITNSPVSFTSMACDGSNLYVACNQNRINKINLGTANVIVFANSVVGLSIAVSGGYLYWHDRTNVVRLSTSTFAGTPTTIFSGSTYPSISGIYVNGILVCGDYLYMTNQYGNSIIYGQISTGKILNAQFITNSTPGVSFYEPCGIVYTNGYFYVANVRGNTISQVAPIVSTYPSVGVTVYSSPFNQVVATDASSGTMFCLKFQDTSGSYVVNFNSVYSAQTLLVGGGGGGGYAASTYEGAGGGGGGEVIYMNGVAYTPGVNYIITVGSGGTGGTASTSTIPTNGGSSSIVGNFIVTASGGGYGAYASASPTPGNGGSGGGGDGSNNPLNGPGGTSTNTPIGITNSANVAVYTNVSVYGNTGGTGTYKGAGGGGGGASSAGQPGSTSGGAGGDGYIFSINSYTFGSYGGGGGGGGSGSTYPTSVGFGAGGGTKSGGNGAGNSTLAVDGSANSGGGGGGGSGYNVNGANGGSGIVIIGIPIANISGTGTYTVASSGIYTLYKFLSETCTFSVGANTFAQILCVGGGGGGGGGTADRRDGAGGGGAGQVTISTKDLQKNVTYNVTVGSAAVSSYGSYGTNSSSYTVGASYAIGGAQSSFTSAGIINIISAGGGYGGSSWTNAPPGGTGGCGGGSSGINGAGNYRVGGAATPSTTTLTKQSSTYYNSGGTGINDGYGGYGGSAIFTMTNSADVPLTGGYVWPIDGYSYAQGGPGGTNIGAQTAAALSFPNTGNGGAGASANSFGALGAGGIVIVAITNYYTSTLYKYSSSNDIFPLFYPRMFSTAAPNTGYTLNGIDMANYFEPFRVDCSNITAVTNYKVNGLDFNQVFAPLNTIPSALYSYGIQNRSTATIYRTTTDTWFIFTQGTNTINFYQAPTSILLNRIPTYIATIVLVGGGGAGANTTSGGGGGGGAGAGRILTGYQILSNTTYSITCGAGSNSSSAGGSSSFSYSSVSASAVGGNSAASTGTTGAIGGNSTSNTNTINGITAIDASGGNGGANGGSGGGVSSSITGYSINSTAISTAITFSQGTGGSTTAVGGNGTYGSGGGGGRGATASYSTGGNGFVIIVLAGTLI